MSYKRSKYFTISKKKKIKYLFIKKNSQITVVFFHGFMSDMVGAKPTAIQKFCKSHSLSFLKFEYSGHGKSSGRFIQGNISRWTKDAKQLIKSKIKKKQNLIFIGSSMGSWIALNLFPIFKKQIKGFIGIASAPEFLEELIWKKFDKKIKKTILTKKIYYLEVGEYTYPITKQLIFDGRKNKILNNKINLKIPITLFHGTKDDVVPLNFSKKIMKVCKKSKKKLIKIKNGDHSLSRKNDLKKICNELDSIIKIKQFS
jgi:Predicted hydrolases or acyltransferases (alpha/beta hydrolase superfamily)|tara:strand:- start:1926 stop:2696 length:771 start_codon:yes stop_codon:yes gene_type:complete